MRAHPDLTDEVAAQVEPATVAFHGVRRSGITAGDMVVVQARWPDRPAGTAVRPGCLRRGCAGRRAIAGASSACPRAWCDQRRGTGRGSRTRPGPHRKASARMWSSSAPGTAPVADRGRPGPLRRRGPAPQLSLRACYHLRRTVAGQAGHGRRLERVHPRRLPPHHDLPGRRPGAAQPFHSRTVRLDELEATLRGLSAGPSL